MQFRNHMMFLQHRQLVPYTCGESVEKRMEKGERRREKGERGEGEREGEKREKEKGERDPPVPPLCYVHQTWS